MAKDDLVKVTVAKLGADDIIIPIPDGAEVCKVAGRSGMDIRGCVFQVDGQTVDAQHKMHDGQVLTLVPRVEGGK